MASAPENSGLPLLYTSLTPLNREQHANFRARTTDRAPWLANVHAIPLTVEEFPQAQRHFPIIFTTGPDPVPLALMGMNEGVNVFIDAEGNVLDRVYMPAYARRYPFLLAKLRPDAEELSLCYDPSSGLIGEFEDGPALFENGEPSELCRNSLKFCEEFEIAAGKTATFMRELIKHDLLTDGELKVSLDGSDRQHTYTGFRMVNETKLREMRGDVLRNWTQIGMLPLIYAHLFSLELVRDLLGRASEQGKVPAELMRPQAVN